MSFFDENLEDLSQDSKYYFNIAVVCIAVQPNFMEKILGTTTSVWYTDQIVGPRPYVIHVYANNNLNKDFDYEYFIIPHCVIEVSNQNEISYYNMIDFDTDDTWRIDGFMEEEYL